MQRSWTSTLITRTHPHGYPHPSIAQAPAWDELQTCMRCARASLARLPGVARSCQVLGSKQALGWCRSMTLMLVPDPFLHYYSYTRCPAVSLNRRPSLIPLITQRHRRPTTSPSPRLLSWWHRGLPYAAVQCSQHGRRLMHRLLQFHLWPL